MAIPSGSGTEVLKNGVFAAVSTSAIKLIDGVADHIYTVISITICNTAAANETFDLYLNTPDVVEILSDQALAANKTFVFNDRLVLTGTHELVIATASAADVDCVVSYIDQDWS
jgi:hypothetical protein